jgi:hypothetical protein
MLYYGDKISPNMVKTDEGYLICKNVPLGKVGTMQYMGDELPAEFGLKSDAVVNCMRPPESLFNKDTIASFEGKPVTNLHPSELLTAGTISAYSRGHVQNVHREGDFLVGDLYITDPGLISEIENNQKREVSSGYLSGWTKGKNGKYEQVDIKGNHVAVVPNGRAGHKVAIKDSAENLKLQKSGGNKMDKNTLIGKILSKFAMDAEPEEVAAASKMLNEKDAQKPVKDAEPAPSSVEATTVTKDADPGQDKMGELEMKVDKLIDIVTALVASDKKVHETAAKETMDELEGELNIPAQAPVGDEDPEEIQPDEAQVEPDEDDEVAPEMVEDEEPIKKLVKDMRPVIMAIKDEKVRNAVAQKFVKAVRDSRPAQVHTGIYGQIARNSANTRKKAVMDSAAKKPENFADRGAKAVDAWADAAKRLQGGK